MSGGSTTWNRSDPLVRSRRRGVRVFERRITAAMRDAGFAPPQLPSLLVATSGGADSTALLLALAEHVRRTSGSRLHACYIDHGLRAAAEIDAERERLAELCPRLGIAFHAVRVDVAAERKAHHLSWEAAARRCRYAALRDVCVRLGATVIVTGHTADDQAETVLMRILRGTGLKGLRAMAVASRPWGGDGPLLLRPLLGTAREETESYCRARGTDWSTDSSNISARFTRNRVRRELLPLLRGLYPGGGTALRRLAAQAEEFGGWLDAEVDAAIASRWRSDGDCGLLTDGDSPLTPFLRSQVVAAVLARLLDAPGPPSERVVQAVVRLWGGPVGHRIAVGGGWQALATSAGVRFERLTARRPDHETLWRGERWQLTPGVTRLPGWRVTVRPPVPASTGVDASPGQVGVFVASIRSEVVAGAALSVRYWQPGERMVPAGMAEAKKLQDIFVDEKVPHEQRRSLPLLYLGERCIWIPGVKRSEQVLPRHAPDEACFVVTFEPERSGGAGFD